MKEFSDIEKKMLEDLNKEMSEIIRTSLQKKSLNGVCYNCGGLKKMLLPSACLLPLANENGDNEITFGVVCVNCGVITSYLSHILLNQEDQLKMDSISEKVQSIIKGVKE